MVWQAESKLTSTVFSVLVREIYQVLEKLQDFIKSVIKPGGEVQRVSVSADCPKLESAVSHLHASSVEVSPGAQVHLSCDPGFYLVGEPVLQCQNKGEWSHLLPSCESKAQN